MKINYLEFISVDIWNDKFETENPKDRKWIVKIDLEIELSSKRVIKIPKGYIWDGASIPKWLWWLMKPIDKGALGDLIHDRLWENKDEELEIFNFNIFEARKFADNERVIWRNNHAPNKKIKTYVTNKVIRWIGGFFYSRQLNIPK